MSDYGTMGAAVIGGFANGILGAIGQNYQKELIMQQLGLNYHYNELAAENADRRTRNLYNDFYSPQALLNQYRAAGLSPALMFGGTPGQGGMSGAQGNGAAGPMQAPIFNPQSILEGALAAAQISNLKAQTKKTEAEASNISQDTRIKEIQTEMEGMNLQQYQQEWTITNSVWTDKATGKETSLFEMADNYYSYEAFLNAVRDEETSPSIKQAAQTESGQRVLRSIYESSNRFRRDIMVLSEETINSKFQLDITNSLKDSGFIELNTEAAIAQLKQSIATNELTAQQKEAWNNIINKLGKKGSTMKDVIIVLGMILGNFASHTGIKINMGGK